jgi:hypothetical protein
MQGSFKFSIYLSQGEKSVALCSLHTDYNLILVIIALDICYSQNHYGSTVKTLVQTFPVVLLLQMFPDCLNLNIGSLPSNGRNVFASLYLPKSLAERGWCESVPWTSLAEMSHWVCQGSFWRSQPMCPTSEVRNGSSTVSRLVKPE